MDRSQLLSQLRLPDGDLIIRLSGTPAEWLILKADVLKRGSAMLRAQLDPKWGLETTWRMHPVTGVQAPMRTLSLAWDGETFSLLRKGTDRNLALSTTSHDMSPKFKPSSFIFDRDPVQDNVHPSLLAAHDLKIMFALICDLPVIFDHLPLRPQPNSEDALKLGIERLASIATHAEYYAVDVLPKLKDMLFEYLFASTIDFGPDGSWIDLLRLSKGLKFPELYLEIILQASQVELEDAAVLKLAATLGRTHTETTDLLKNAREEGLKEFNAQLTNIVHIPLIGITSPYIGPKDEIMARNRPWKNNVKHNARQLAGSIWEAYMLYWFYWLDLQWSQHERGTTPSLRQRFTRYGFFATPVGAQGKWTVVNDATTDEELESGEIRSRDLQALAYRKFLTTVRPAILEASRSGNTLELFQPSVVETFMNMVWEHERIPRGESKRNEPDADGQIMDGLIRLNRRKYFIDMVHASLDWYVHEAANFIRRSLRFANDLPPTGSGTNWDLFEDAEYTWADVETVPIRWYLDLETKAFDRGRDSTNSRMTAVHAWSPCTMPPAPAKILENKIKQPILWRFGFDDYGQPDIVRVEAILNRHYARNTPEQDDEPEEPVKFD